MDNFRCGVHTIELKSDHIIWFEDLPPNANKAIKPIDKNRYHFNLADFTGTEYLPTAAAEEAISAALEACRDKTGAPPLVTRIDWRIDSYSQSYKSLIPFMRPLVYAFAQKYSLLERVMEWTKLSGGEMGSIRAMPNGKDTSETRGIEFYNKPLQIESERSGKARLEFRRLNMSGERLSYVLDQWRHDLQQISKSDYLSALEYHAKELFKNHYTDGERIGVFIRSHHSDMSGREQEKIFYELAGKTPQRRKSSAALPCWEDTRQTIERICDMFTN
ncbi:MAG: hypothetical protein J6A79_08265 [Clostridia bacterium]|nr:hypothetical protein [Clostridia bacterium]